VNCLGGATGRSERFPGRAEERPKFSDRGEMKIGSPVGRPGDLPEPEVFLRGINAIPVEAGRALALDVTLLGRKDLCDLFIMGCSRFSDRSFSRDTSAHSDTHSAKRKPCSKPAQKLSTTGLTPCG